jgi:predicted TIM-barrel fold metal-dependent hydrolase
VIVDCHTHWGSVWTQQDGEDPRNWLAVLDKHGVDKVFLFGLDNLHRLDLCQADNVRLARLAIRGGGRLIPFGTAWPQQGSTGVEEVRRCVEDLGMPALKFHPWIQGFSTADETFGEICGLAGELGAPILLHDGTPCYSMPEQIGGLARRFPQTRFVLGHSGLLWSWRSALEAARHPNVWLCLCGPHMRAIELICQRADPDRLLWGSDFGFGFADTVRYRLAVFSQANISPAIREQVLGVNPFRLLDLA